MLQINSLPAVVWRRTQRVTTSFRAMDTERRWSRRSASVNRARQESYELINCGADQHDYK
jgi:hypothetical protein